MSSGFTVKQQQLQQHASDHRHVAGRKDISVTMEGLERSGAQSVLQTTTAPKAKTSRKRSRKTVNDDGDGAPQELARDSTSAGQAIRIVTAFDNERSRALPCNNNNNNLRAASSSSTSSRPDLHGEVLMQRHEDRRLYLAPFELVMRDSSAHVSHDGQPLGRFQFSSTSNGDMLLSFEVTLNVSNLERFKGGRLFCDFEVIRALPCDQEWSRNEYYAIFTQQYNDATQLCCFSSSPGGFFRADYEDRPAAAEDGGVSSASGEDVSLFVRPSRPRPVLSLWEEDECLRHFFSVSFILPDFTEPGMSVPVSLYRLMMQPSNARDVFCRLVEKPFLMGPEPQLVATLDEVCIHPRPSHIDLDLNISFLLAFEPSLLRFHLDVGSDLPRVDLTDCVSVMALSDSVYHVVVHCPYIPKAQVYAAYALTTDVVQCPDDQWQQDPSNQFDCSRLLHTRMTF
jgi:hypothetical protein